MALSEESTANCSTCIVLNYYINKSVRLSFADVEYDTCEIWQHRKGHQIFDNMVNEIVHLVAAYYGKSMECCPQIENKVHSIRNNNYFVNVLPYSCV